MRKNILLLLLLCFFFATSYPIVAQNTYVLITGISNYPGSNKDVGQTTKDAKKLAAFWQEQTRNVTLLTGKYVTQDNITQKLTEICDVATENDIVVFYYAGHGLKDFLYLYDGPYSYRRLLSILNDCKAKARICFLNACQSGSIGNFTKNTDNPTYAWFTSSRETEESWESKQLGAGFFSNALLKGLLKAADANKDNLITVKELFSYIYADVNRRKQQQHPQLYAPKQMHDFVIIDWNKKE